MSDQGSGARTGKVGRGVRLALLASLAVNLVVVGAVAGFVWMGPTSPPHERSGGPDAVMPYIRALTQDQRHELRDTWRGGAGPKDRRDMRGLRAQMIQEYQAAAAVLRSDPYDPAALEAVLAAQAERSAGIRARGQSVLSEYVAGMTAEERAAYADRLEESLERFQRRGAPDRDHKGRD
ncbi:periplasmic heavy metal sensor [Sagittula sp. NFXS13]|uniref:periplasmic heavy metal sensor n=1 Tax=Sagittula sp. NFXS13 TaxID=2819095 RepID=UPI0032DF0D50